MYMENFNLSNILKQEIKKCIDPQYGSLVLLEIPPLPQFGEFSSNIAMVMARHLKKSPAIIANEIKESLEKSPEFTKHFEAVIPGNSAYINFYIRAELFPDLVRGIVSSNAFGRGEKKNKKILLEFLSANPTGPMHLGNGRGGFTGDCLANVLEWAGYKVWREYYVNDTGNQVVNLGKSIMAVAGFYHKKESSPDGEVKEKLYKADYINDLVKQLNPKKDDTIEEIGKRGVATMLKNIQRVAKEKMAIKYDQWYSEQSLYDAKKIDAILQWLEKENLTYEKDGARWFASSRFGDEKDRVAVKSDGGKTYMLSDIAYHKDKFERGYDHLINILGADHHGYVGRTYAIIESLGYKKEQLDIILVQMVRLIENGKEVKMSKRGGTFVTIEELIDEVGHDVARFFFVMRAPETHMDFDLNLAKEHSNKNPVYYVQYAHTRICSILEKTKGLEIVKIKDENEYAPNSHERVLVAHLMRFPDLIEETAKTYAVHHLPAYAIKLADLFHRFYEHCRVIEDNKVNEERLKIIKAARIVLRNVLMVIGVSAPEKM